MAYFVDTRGDVRQYGVASPDTIRLLDTGAEFTPDDSRLFATVLGAESFAVGVLLALEGIGYNAALKYFRIGWAHEETATFVENFSNGWASCGGIRNV